jgi:hypothetical protein
MKRATVVLAAGILGGVLCAPVFAARAPDAVERKIVLTGPAALAVAKLFEIATSSSSASLRLGRPDSWAVYLLKQDTVTPLWNDNEGSPERYDSMAFSSSPEPSLTIGPYWLDWGTGLPNPRPGYYSFGSPFLSEKLDQQDPWTRLVRRLQAEPEWKGAARVQFRRCFASPDGTELCVEVWSREDYPDNKKVIGHVVTLTAHGKA